MALESATYISQLVDTNPAGSDVISQGDDHIRLIKKVVQDSLPDVDQVATTIITKATAPTTQIKGTIWYDTSANLIKINTASTASSPAWVTINAGAPWASEIPSQTGHSGKYLTTDGSSASWGANNSAFGGSAAGYRSFSVTKGGADQTIATGTATKVTWPTEEWDTGSVFASDKFTCDVAGKYHFYTAIKYTGLAVYDNELRIYKNGSTARYANYFISYDAGENTGKPTMQMEVALDLSVSDYVEVYAHQESGGNLDIDGATNASWFTGHRIE